MRSTPWSIRCRRTRWWGSATRSGLASTRSAAATSASCASIPAARPGISSVTAAYYHIASGVCDVVLTAGADKVGECGDSQTVLNKIWDPTYERPLPLGTINMLAMSAVRYMRRYGMTEEDMAYVTVKNRRQASLNPRAHLRKLVTIDEVMDSRIISWPIKLMDCCPQSTGGAAMVLASERFIRDNKLRCCLDHRSRLPGGDLLDGRPDGQQSDRRACRRLCSGPVVRAVLSHGRHHRSGEPGACRGTLRAVQQHRVSRDRRRLPGREVRRIRSDACAMASSNSAAASRSIRRAVRCAPTRSR